MIGLYEPRMLHRHAAHGYTQAPAHAMRREPPAITESDQDELTALSRDREHRTWQTSRRRLLAEIEHLRIHVHDPHVARAARSLEREIRALHEKLSR